MRVREPVNALTHFVGLLLASGGTVALLRMAAGRSELIGFAIYGATLILLYLVSTLYHGLWLAERSRRALRTLDHIAIYFLIAGTYTPVALIALHGTVKWAMLASVWLIAAAGIPFKILFLECHPWVSTGSYLAMGYMALFAVGPVARAVGPWPLTWLVAGGLAYTVGAVIYTRERPNPVPGVFGHHEIWHLFVLVGSACHFAFIALHLTGG